MCEVATAIESTKVDLVQRDSMGNGYPSDICCRTDPSSWVANAHKDRLLYPLIRKNGQLERASWEEAMSLIVEKTKEVHRRLTNHGIGFYTTGQLFLEEYYALAMIGKAGLNTLHMYVSLTDSGAPGNAEC